MSSLTENTSSWCANWQITKSHPNCKSKQHVSAKAPGFAHSFSKTWFTGIPIICCVIQIHLFHTYDGFAPCFTLQNTKPPPQPCSSPARAEPRVCPWPKYFTCAPYSQLNFSSSGAQGCPTTAIPLEDIERPKNFPLVSGCILSFLEQHKPWRLVSTHPSSLGGTTQQYQESLEKVQEGQPKPNYCTDHKESG